MLKSIVLVACFSFALVTHAQTFTINTINGLPFQDNGTVDFSKLSTLTGTTDVGMGHVDMSLYDSTGKLVSSNFVSYNLFSPGSVSISHANCFICIGALRNLKTGSTYRIDIVTTDMSKMNMLTFSSPTTTASHLVINGIPGAVINTSTNDCTLNWLEDRYSTYLSPTRQTTQAASSYSYRYYSGSNTYIAVSSADSHLYFMSTATGLVDLGLASTFAGQAGCH